MPVHTAPEEFKNKTITGHFGFVYEENDYDAIVSEKFGFHNVFRPHENEKSALSIFSGFKSGFAKFRFRDGLVWTSASKSKRQFSF